VGFGGLVVAAFESRRAKEIAALIANYGGIPLVAPSMREIPLEENPAAFAFAEQLFAKRVDAVILMTGVGTETLVEVLEATDADMLPEIPQPRKCCVCGLGDRSRHIKMEYQLGRTRSNFASTVIRMSYKNRQKPANCEKNAKVERVSGLHQLAATCCFFSFGVGSGKI